MTENGAKIGTLFLDAYIFLANTQCISLDLTYFF